MKPTLPFCSCPHEPELKSLLAAGQWPQAAPSELRAHVASCRACNDLALLTGSFQAERAAASAMAQLPPPGVLWWRAQLRRRNAALERMSRPILGAQLFALATALVAVIGFLFFVRHSVTRWLGSLSQSADDSGAAHLTTLFPSSTIQWLGITWNLAYLLPTVALLILAGGVAVYMASERT
jgi:hypothetical protein